MFPSLLAQDIRTGLKNFLTAGFEPSDAFFNGLVERFSGEEQRWMKGPWLQIGLPFTPGMRGRDYFENFQVLFPGYVHQEAAWERVRADRPAANTLVATATGSGKTECFLYPVLDHCARALRQGERGIKALAIYPMNALANDQAQRFAGIVSGDPYFQGLRIGLFVGGGHGEKGRGTVMTPVSVINDRDTLRENPPDILLTNYKMLDYLLVRPVDQPLWKHNAPQTLRYIVVDEIHTFDGAQGTDLAMLLRRLYARLKVEKQRLICVGTSATLGDQSDSKPLREYARQVFAADFEEASVITEKRLTVSEFLQDMPVEHVFQHRDGLEKALDPLNYCKPETALKTWFSVFFPEITPPSEAQIGDAGWRCELGRELKKHLLFQNLLRQLKLREEIAEMSLLAESFNNTLPRESRPHAMGILNALLALCAWARRPAGKDTGKALPLVTLRVQLWLRELRRMVAGLSNRREEVELLPEADMPPNPERLYLPLIQCSECHTSGWLSRVPAGQNTVARDLDLIYSAWFSNHSECARLYPREGVQNPIGEAHERGLCCGCGLLQDAGRSKCLHCPGESVIALWKISQTRETQRGGVTAVRHLHRCPSCGSRDRLILLGARSTTLGSQVVEQSWHTPFNDDKKLISFSDSVQDAAHRAGFFGARTYTGSVRRAVFQAARMLETENLMLSHFLNRLERCWQEPGSPLQMSPEKFVSEFIGPNMQWQDDWEKLNREETLPQKSRLVERVGKRLGWQAFAELSYLNRRGRSLERLGLLTAAPDPDAVLRAARDLREPLAQELGLEQQESALFRWLWGFLDYLRQRGAVYHQAMEGYAKSGNLFIFLNAQQNRLWLPGMGINSFHPVFLSLNGHRYFDRISSRQGNTWYETWLEKNFVMTPQGIAEPAYGMAIRKLETSGVMLRLQGERGDVAVALNPDALEIVRQPVQLFSAQGQYWLNVPEKAVESLLGMCCLDGDEQYRKTRAQSKPTVRRLARADQGRVIAAEHTGLLDRKPREDLEKRFKARERKPWYENLLSATPTLEMGVDIGDLSSIMLCSVPPNQASYLQRIGRAGRRDGNAFTLTLADGNSPHDLYFFISPEEMIRGKVQPPGVFLQAAEVLRRQLFAFCLDNWVAGELPDRVFPEKTKGALDALETLDVGKFPRVFQDFVLQNEQELLDGFLDLLRPDLDAAVERRLAGFLRAESEEDHLRIRLQKVLEEIVEERGLYKEKAEEIKKRIDKLKKIPQDERIQNEIDQLKLERQKLLEMVRELENRDLLNTLTDAGLIPNYAFPETGIELKSVIWRRRQDRQGDFFAPAYKYERPAATAISEFAPNNRFYANQRRVQIDQVNMDLATSESWRLCPECHYMRRIDAVHQDDLISCPRCGTDQWQNVSQKQNLLRFRQVIATTEDARSRIDDRTEEREPRFYVRQMLVDFERQAVREAWKLKREDLPFGFEFIAHADFRDINFGEVTRQGVEFSVAGSLRMRPGFSLCGQCGKVQNRSFPSDDSRNDSASDHAIDCVHRDTNEDDTVVNLHLYRHFSSEALRILVPYTKSGVDDQVVQSFIAAIQLGFKLQFGGRVDHLRFIEQDLPGPDGEGRRHYIMIYDSVPGGTGYLHQLLSEKARTMLELLRKAHQHILECSCGEDPDRDGCYRCLYQYRISRRFSGKSRVRALEVLAQLLEAEEEWERVETISDIQINPHLGSALEQMFLESLKKLSRQNSLPPVRMIQEIINGKAGYLLEVGEQRYRIELQKLLGNEEGVAAQSRPDFVISALKPAAGERSIAVFCDGWEYHKEITDDDAKKRYECFARTLAHLSASFAETLCYR